MVSTTDASRKQGSGPDSAPNSLDEDHRQIRRAEKWFFAGVIITGSVLVGPLGIPVLLYGLYQLRKIERQGRAAVRPWHVSVIGAFAIIDAAANFIGWSFDLFAPNTGIGYTMLQHGYGHGFDGFYWHGFGAGLFGGVAPTTGEKSYIIMAVFVVWSMRLAAAWAFLKMKRWGLRWMVTSTWLLVTFWVGWISNGVVNFDGRFGQNSGSLYGVAGWWVFNCWYILGPVVMVPYLYTVNRELWTED